MSESAIPPREVSPSGLSLTELRENYTRGELSETSAASDPVRQFERWFQEALESKLHEPNAMTLATATASGEPSARVVLLKGAGDEGFLFYTNYDSRKGRELAENPRAALTFFWAELERQVRIEGRVSRTSRADSEAYFQSRPRGSRLGAWASEQSTVVGGRAELESKLAEADARFASGAVPLPPFWGGYRVEPVRFEFWQGRPNRLHDRLRYTKDKAGFWIIKRLSP